MVEVLISTKSKSLNNRQGSEEALKMAIEWFEHKGYSNERQPILEALREALEQPSNMVTVPRDKLQDMQRRLSDCEEYLKEDETPAQCIERNRKANLYLHPPRTTTLCDDEIEAIYSVETGFSMHEGHGSDIALLDFARAVLRKAGVE